MKVKIGWMLLANIIVTVLAIMLGVGLAAKYGMFIGAFISTSMWLWYQWMIMHIDY